MLGEDGLDWAMEAETPLLLLDAECGCHHMLCSAVQPSCSPDRSAHPVHLICRFPLKREESGSLIKGAWLKRPVIRGARNLNLKRPV